MYKGSSGSNRRRHDDLTPSFFCRFRRVDATLDLAEQILGMIHVVDPRAWSPVEQLWKGDPNMTFIGSAVVVIW